jgi:hypothetical protein
MLPYITIEGSGYVLRTVLLLTCAAVYCVAVRSPEIPKRMYYLTPNADRGGDWMLPYITIEGSGYVLCML